MSPEETLATLVAQRLDARGADAPPLVLGLCGAQGSGKSTLADAIARRFDRAATLSLDDLYKMRSDRLAMAASVHPLFATRGVPGTHDVALGIDVLDAVARGETPLLPRFDKASDDRAPQSRWHRVPAGCRLLVFEGWCVGARPQDEAALVEPVNALERDQDAGGVWRRAVNAALATEYQTLFDRMDLLVLLAAPDMATVVDWRTGQEHALRASAADPASASAIMTDDQIGRFVMHFERLTRHILSEMPGRADLTIALDRHRQMLSAHQRLAED